MKSQRPNPNLQRTRPVKVMPPDGPALDRKIHDAVAWRAFRLYEARGGTPGHDAEDWRAAQAEVIRPLECGAIVENGTVCLTTNLSCFGSGPVEIWVQPHCFTLCGPSPEAAQERKEIAVSASGQKNWIFRTHEMAAELDPARVVVKFNGPAMHIYVSRVVAEPQEAALAHHAA